MTRLKELRELKGLKQKDIAQLIGKTVQAYSLYERGERNIDNDTLKLLSNFYKVTTDYLLNAESDNARQRKKTGVKIPVLGCVAAGIPIEAITEIIDYEEISESMAQTGEFFALIAKGDSMNPTIVDGDILIVRKQDMVEEGQTAIILVDGDDATVKRIHCTNSGVTLIGDNPAVFPPHFYTKEEIETLPVRIIGRVVEIRRKMI